VREDAGNKSILTSPAKTPTGMGHTRIQKGLRTGELIETELRLERLTKVRTDQKCWARGMDVSLRRDLSRL
jgi:hypothetical protein